ncbi:MAG: preprotein translocase subunit YajC [Selenomonadaceae bacterium]|nr:preprotein translocase subunit YajC [Selenomonadaceae bacterium]
MDMATAMATWGPIAVMLIIFYFLLYRPQKKAQQEREEMLNSLTKGTKVITIGGIYGIITQLNEKVVTLKIAEKVEIEISRGSIGSIVKGDSSEVSL